MGVARTALIVGAGIGGLSAGIALRQAGWHIRILVKLLNVINLLPIVAFFMLVPLQYVVGVLPSYWPMRAGWSAAAGDEYGGYLLCGAIIGAGAIVSAAALFERRLLRRRRLRNDSRSCSASHSVHVWRRTVGPMTPERRA